MTHIPRILKENCPLINFWLMRYESKHRELKLTAVNTCNRTNILKTIAIRSVLKLAYMRLTKNTNSLQINCKNKKEIDNYTRSQHFPENKEIFFFQLKLNKM